MKVESDSLKIHEDELTENPGKHCLTLYIEVERPNYSIVNSLDLAMNKIASCGRTYLEMSN
jgi:hypothetical protein